MPERIEAVLQLRELGRSITAVLLGGLRGPQGDRNDTGSYHLNYATWQKGKSLDRIAQNVDTSCGIFWVTNPGEGYFVSTVGRNEGPRLHQSQEAADKQLDQLQLKLASS